MQGLGWHVLRTAIVTLAALPFAHLVAVGTARGRVRHLAWLLLALVLLFPPLLVGYGWSLLPWPWLMSDLGRELLYAALLLARGLALGAVLLLLLPPPPVGEEARFVARSAGLGPWHRLRLLFADRGRRVLVTAGVVFLVSFTEFEFAARLAVSRAASLNWSVTLFDYYDYTGGSLPAVLARVRAPLLIQAMLCAGLLVTLRFHRSEAEDRPTVGRGRSAGAVAWPVLVVAAAVVLTPPAWYMVRHGVVNLVAAVADTEFWRRLAASAAMAAAAATACLLLVVSLRRRRWLAVLLMLPGCCGSLVVGLLIKHSISGEGSGWWQATPYPLLAGATLLLLPVGVLVCLPVLDGGDRTAWHVAREQVSPERRGLVVDVWWREIGGRVFWCWVLCLHLAFHEVVAGALLAPVTMPLLPSLLYNHMHYSQSVVLWARSAIMLLATPAVALMLYATLRGGLRLAVGRRRGTG